MARLPDFYWSLERYHAAIKAGVLTENDKVELLFGKLVPKMPIGVSHGKAVKKINRLFNRRLPEDQYTIGVQDPITLIDDSEPEPDLHVAKGPLEAYTQHPRPADILLVVEVADSTLATDRSVKKLNYAVAGIEEYWIVNIYEQQVERYIGPDSTGGTYATREVFKTGDTVTSLHLGAFAVEELLIK